MRLIFGKSDGIVEDRLRQVQLEDALEHLLDQNLVAWAGVSGELP